jgi:hypothetical protein
VNFANLSLASIKNKIKTLEQGNFVKLLASGKLGEFGAFLANLVNVASLGSLVSLASFTSL